MIPTVRRLAAAATLAVVPAAVLAQVHVHSKITIGKHDDKERIAASAVELLKIALEHKPALDPTVILAVRSLNEQLERVVAAEHTLAAEEAKLDHWTKKEHKLRPLFKLRAKAASKKAPMTPLIVSAQDWIDLHGRKLPLDRPVLIKGAKQAAPFAGEKWESLRHQLNARSLADSKSLDKNWRLPYFPPDQARARMVGNQMVMEPPQLISFARWMTQCFAGSPAAPKLPGYATEHCEQEASVTEVLRAAGSEEAVALKAALDSATLAAYRGGVRDESNLLHLWQQRDESWFSERWPELKKRVSRALTAGSKKKDKKAKKDQKANVAKVVEQLETAVAPQKFLSLVFGAAGSGAQLRAENGLPFVDLLVYGERRWLLMREETVIQVAEKAREAMEFQNTTAYMFFEEKLPELKEEFELRDFIEVNQEEGDILLVPNGWYRVSLALDASLSVKETFLFDSAGAQSIELPGDVGAEKKGTQRQKTKKNKARQLFTSYEQVHELVTDQAIFAPQMNKFDVAFCFTEPKQLAANVTSLGPQGDQWLQQQVSQMSATDRLPGVISVLQKCNRFEGQQGLCTDGLRKACEATLRSALDEDLDDLDQEL